MSTKVTTFALVKTKYVLDIGEMAEWSIAAVLKTVEGHTSGGSNPSLSAKPAEIISGFLFYNKFPISISVSFLYICKVMIPYMIYSESM